MSKLIHINSDMVEDLIIQGFHPVENEKFCISAKLNKDIIHFINSYENLEIDQYVLDKEEKTYRKRRYGSFTYNVQENCLSVNEHKTFIQSKKANSAYGDIERKFAAIESQIMENDFLHELIKANFDKFPKIDKSLSQKWFVGIQMFRIEATKDFIGEPTPEGIHQDEHHFVVQHMINKINVKGGVSSIYSLDKKKIASLTFNNFLDSCYVKDEMVMHSVSCIECENIDDIATRDMLILDYKLIN